MFCWLQPDDANWMTANRMTRFKHSERFLRFWSITVEKKTIEHQKSRNWKILKSILQSGYLLAWIIRRTTYGTISCRIINTSDCFVSCIAISAHIIRMPTITHLFRFPAFFFWYENWVDPNWVPLSATTIIARCQNLTDSLL